MKKQSISANIVDVLDERIFPGTISIVDGRIFSITEDDEEYEHFIIPGFVDSHIHIESSMLVPSEFARLAVTHGTVAVVADAHEIANVLGIDGIKFMIENAKLSPMKFAFSAPPCVPATSFETSGANISSEDIETLFKDYPEIMFLGEMMNYPGVVNDDGEILRKIAIAKEHNKPIDGHAPGLSGAELEKYISAGISTDHECSTKGEALEKLGLGMKVLIREGSAAKNFSELIPLANKYPESIMFCSDDKHPDDLLAGHINDLVIRAIDNDIDIMNVLRIACVNPVKHYGLDVGLLQINDPADFLLVEDLEEFNIIQTVIDGNIVARKERTLLPYKKITAVNNFNVHPKRAREFFIEHRYTKSPVIEVLDGQLTTNRIEREIKTENHNLISDTENDILKIAVINRYENRNPELAFVKNFGLKKGAIASSVAHDSHNIVVVGVSEEDICSAVNMIIREKGGICAVCEEDGISEILPLPVAGLMSDKRYDTVAAKYSKLDALAKELGSELSAPFMTLSFMALLVIPEIKLSDKGLFDGNKFEFIT
ncbi:MAG: adenine deaminase [Candidatus Marinimicrobia bacterium]|nr:adenine deaminase [Candidatus Neomarinimicrobiota bacterium]